MSNAGVSQYRVGRILAEDPELRERDERLEGLKAVVGKLGHDFNNFLVPLLGYVTLLKEDIPQESGAMQYARTLENSARKIESYLDSILLAMRPHRHFNPREIKLDELLHTCLNEWQNALGPTAQVEVETNIEPARAMLDEGQWISAINALLSNARYALATGGNLRVRLEEKKLDAAEAKRLGVEAAEAFVLSIEDTGFGMSEEQARRCFEPFFTTRTGVKAAGVGLTIVHSVVQLQGGQVALETKEDQGTKVTLWIPPTPAGVQINRLSNVKKWSSTESKILLVDDDPLIREVIRGALEKTGREVFVAGDGEEALRTFSRYKNEWALIISDIMMPRKGGVEFYQEVKEQAPGVRFLFLTGNLDFSNEKLMAQPGVEPPMIIRKPFTLKSFNGVVERLLS